MSAEAGLTANRAGVGETFQLKVTITNDTKINNLPWPRVKGLEPFKVNKNTTTSSSTHTTVINGKISQSQTYVTEFIYILTPKKMGDFVIGPIFYSYKKFNKTLGSAKVTVVKTESGLDLVPSLSKSSVYVGEQVRYKLRIIPKTSVQNIRPPDFSKVIGKSFYMVQFEKDIKLKVVSIKGVQTKVFDIQFAMFPLIKDKGKFPTYTIEYEEVVRNRSRRRSVFDNFFGGGGRILQKTANTHPLSIKVKTLPPGAPKNFTGAVGKYWVKANINTNQLASGDALTLTITISGNGQPKTITKPILPELPQFEIFQPEVTRTTKILNNYLTSTTIFKYALVPAKKGTFKIPPIKFDYFEPKSKTYKTAMSQDFEIIVSQGKKIHSGTRLFNQKNIKEIGADIRHIKKIAGPLIDSSAHLYKMPWYWAMYLLAPILYMSLFISRKRTEKLGADEGLRRKIQAKGFAKKRLIQAKQAMEGNSSPEFYKTLNNALERFISDKFNLELRGLAIDVARRELKEKNLSEEHQNEYIRILEACELGQFTGSQKNIEAWQKNYTETENLINNINKT